MPEKILKETFCQEKTDSYICTPLSGKVLKKLIVATEIKRTKKFIW